jgi:(p)ppGpp synthase/HD superfamily hydrolase
MNLLDILDEIWLERERRLLGLLKPDPHALVLWSRASTSLVDDAERELLAQALSFAKAIKYRHVGLSGDIYFSHPMRVAGLAMLLSTEKKLEIGIVSVLHNVLEVSDVSINELSKKFGRRISNQINTLTVDRKVQWDKAYKVSYYNQLINGPLSARIVKILDKLDNLFVLGLNPDASVRNKYLAEIEEFVLPMTVMSLPSITNYMQALVNDCVLTGFIEKPVAPK